MINNNKKCPN